MFNICPQDLYEDSTSDSSDGKSSIEQSSLKSSSVIPPVQLKLSRRELHLLQSFRDKLDILGISYCILDGDSNEMEEGIVQMTRLPACLIEREAAELKRGRPPVAVPMVEVQFKLLCKIFLGKFIMHRTNQINEVFSSVNSTDKCYKRLNETSGYYEDF